jgi:hypothetical protein
MIIRIIMIAVAGVVAGIVAGIVAVRRIATSAFS